MNTEDIVVLHQRITVMEGGLFGWACSCGNQGCSKFLKPPKPAAPPLIPHHIPNILRPEHARDDYDFLYADGVMGPIRLPAQRNDYISMDIAAMVWCKQHGWEKEIFDA